MEDELEKVDAIRKRLGVSYEEARNALGQADGDVVDALAILDKGKDNKIDLLTAVTEIAGEVHNLVGDGKINKVKLKLGNKTLKEFPVALTIAGATILAAAAVILTKCAIEIEKAPNDGS